MNIGSEKYKKYADAHAPKSPMLKNCLKAFLIGGLICAVAEGANQLWHALGISDEDGGLITSVLLILVSAVLTAVGVFDKIAKHAGAGTLVPITGFANSVVSAAVDSRDEGMILGLGAKIFTVAGPVLLYGTLSGAVCGVVYWIVRAVTAV